MFQRPAIDRVSHGQEEDKERTGSLRLKQRHVAASLIHPDAAGGSLEDQNAVYIMLTIVFGAIVIGGFCLIAYAFTTRQRLRELAMRERIAMIERGLVPPPEVDPVRFERIVGASTRPRSERGAARPRARRARHDARSEGTGPGGLASEP